MGRLFFLLLLVTLPALAQERLATILGAKPFAKPVSQGRFELYFYADSEASRQQTMLFKDREEALARIEEFFGRRYFGPIRLLVYPSYPEASPFPCGRTTPEQGLVHVALEPGYWAYERHNPGHELTHLLAMTTAEGKKVWAVPLLNEGLAEYLCGFPVDPHLRLTEWYGRPTRLCIDSSNLWESRDLYPIGGSFVKFLVENYPDGRRKVLQLLEETRPRDWNDKPYFPQFLQTLERVFETDYVTMMADWNRVLEPYWKKAHEPRPEDRAAIERLVGPVEGFHYLRFHRFLQLAALLPGGKKVSVEATPEDGWRLLK